MKEADLARLQDILNINKINNLLELKEKKTQPPEEFLPKIHRIRPFFSKNEKCSFGHWPQWDKTYDGKQTLYWWILREEDGRLLLLCDSILEWMPFDTENHVRQQGYCDWESSTLRKWLNRMFFYQAFNAEERRRICFFDEDVFSEENLMDRVGLPSWSDLSPLSKKEVGLTDRLQKRLGWRPREFWIRKEENVKSYPTFWSVVDKESVHRHLASNPAGVCPAIWIKADTAASDTSI